jgi:hypothetical protein
MTANENGRLGTAPVAQPLRAVDVNLRSQVTHSALLLGCKASSGDAMTKVEQVRLTAWRLRVLRQAANEQNVRAGLPAIRDFPQVLLQMEAATRRARRRRPVRSRAHGADLSPCHVTRRGQQDPPPPPALSLRRRPHLPTKWPESEHSRWQSVIALSWR